jgi:hypothetical protein
MEAWNRDRFKRGLLDFGMRAWIPETQQFLLWMWINTEVGEIDRTKEEQ